MARRRPGLRAAAALSLGLLAVPGLAACGAGQGGTPAAGTTASTSGSATASSPSTPSASPSAGTPSSGAPSASSGGADTAEKLVAAVREEDLRKDLEALMAISDRHGNRAAGTPGYDASVDYAVSELEKAGYDVRLQPFEITYRENTTRAFTLQGSPQGRLEHTVLRYSPPIHATDAPLAAPAVATGCDSAAWAGTSLAGKVALVSRGGCDFYTKSDVAKAKGALGVIFYNDVEGPLYTTLTYPSDSHAGSVAVSREVGQELLAKVRAGGARVTLQVDQLVEQRPSVNVIAETPQGREDELVMLGAHLDSVPFGAGIHDNASGVAATLEVARRLAGVETNANKVRFVLWGAEEIGLLGSRHYVKEMTDAEAADIALYVNADMVAPADGRSPIGILQAPWSLGAERLLKEQLDRDGERAVYMEADGHSDYGPFRGVGVPATGLLADLDAHNHTPQDDLANVSLPTLTHSTRALGNLVGTLMDDTSSLASR